MSYDVSLISNLRLTGITRRYSRTNQFGHVSAGTEIDFLRVRDGKVYPLSFSNFYDPIGSAGDSVKVVLVKHEIGNIDFGWLACLVVNDNTNMCYYIVDELKTCARADKGGEPQLRDEIRALCLKELNLLIPLA